MVNLLEIEHDVDAELLELIAVFEHILARVGKDDVQAQPSREPAQHGLGGVIPCCVPHVQDKAPVAEAELIQPVGCQKLGTEFDHRGRHDLGKLIVHEAAEDILALAAAVKKLLDAALVGIVNGRGDDQIDPGILRRHKAANSVDPVFAGFVHAGHNMRFEIDDHSIISLFLLLDSIKRFRPRQG